MAESIGRFVSHSVYGVRRSHSRAARIPKMRCRSYGYRGFCRAHLIQQFIPHHVVIHSAGNFVNAIRILIADDHKDFRNVVREFLSRLPNVIVVGEAEDGVDVIDKTESLDPDIVLMDITMPGRNGLEATRIIKRRWPAKKVVIATMHDGDFYRSQAEEVLADGFIVKSSIRSGLLATFGEGVFSPVYAPSTTISGT